METINKKELPEGFQSSEFLLDNGFLDAIVERKKLKAKIEQLLRLFKN
jgi:acetyl-CoA carboxylase carboxyl transferase subunit beta